MWQSGCVPSSDSVNADEMITGAPADVLDHLRPIVAGLASTIHHVVDDLHAHPETAFEEYRSVATLAALLRDAGLAVEVGVGGLDTAFRSEIGSGGRAVGILAEYDALPELGHACGHNVIAAAAVGAYLALAGLDAGRPLPGRVVLIGTPAEEGHTGKEYLARAGVFDELDAAVMLHPYSDDIADQLWLGRRTLTVTFAGVSAHASSEPHRGRNALDAATLLLTGIGLFRQQLPPGDRIHAILTEGGTRASVIPERAVVEMYVRSPSPEGLRDLSRRIGDAASGAALMAGVEVDLAWDPHPASLPVRTNQALTARWVAAQVARGRRPLPRDPVRDALAASTDFGNVSHLVPGIHLLIKIADGHALHTRGFAEAAASTPPGRPPWTGVRFGRHRPGLLHDDRLAEAVASEFGAAGGRLSAEHYFE